MTYHAIPYNGFSYTFIRDVTTFYEVITQNLIRNVIASPCRLNSAVPPCSWFGIYYTFWLVSIRVIPIQYNIVTVKDTHKYSH